MGRDRLGRDRRESYQYNVDFGPYCINSTAAQSLPNRPANSQFVGLSFTAIRSFFYINQPAETADIGPVSGSRYVPRLRVTGADWGLDTRIIF